MSGLQTAHTSVVGDAFKVGLQNFVDQSSLINVPYTAIVGRAQIPDLANDLRASLGNERITIQSIYLVPTEAGANGEPVFAALNDDRGLIRFVGSWTSSSAGAYGQYLDCTIAGNYIEITYYGTGLNLLQAGSSSPVFTVTTNGVLGSTITIAASAVPGGTNYSTNQVFSILSGQPLGLYTVKLTLTSGTFDVYGLEVLNINTSGLININPGTAYIQGQKVINTAVDSNAYKPASLTGTKGGRVIQYLNSDGSTGQAVTVVNASVATGAATDHTNEELARKHYFREFGCAYNPTSSTDFSVDGASAAKNYGFTLDDGVTTLMGNNVRILTTNVLELNTNTSTLTFTFEGCGVDIVMGSIGGPSADTLTYQIDGGSVNNYFTNTAGYVNKRVLKTASGLAFGSHTLKLTWPVASSNCQIYDFMVYQPKKPTIPSTALELCDYNVLADTVQNTTAGLETITTGVLRKHAAREVIYVNGTGGSSDWAYGIGDGPLATIANGRAQTDRLNAYFQLTFVGTGFEFRGRCRSDTSASILVTINTLAATTANFPTITAWTYGTGINYSGLSGASITPTTNVFDCQDASSQSGIGMGIKGLPFGLYTVRFTNNAASGYVFFETLDIITPIYSYKSNIYADLQNTLTVGSNSLMDSRKTSMIKEALPAQKAWAQAFGLATTTTTSTSYVPLTNLSTTIKSSGGPLSIVCSVSSSNATASADNYFQIYVDGVAVGTETMMGNSSGSTGVAVSSTNQVVVPAAAGTHKVDVYWKVDGGTGNASGQRRQLVVKEQ